ncbi:MAG: dienelactone hydrolase family protein [Planctomycetes bacterium]|nr:dienelactone hydrolase family protein [Planctomycetota bacterium]
MRPRWLAAAGALVLAAFGTAAGCRMTHRPADASYGGPLPLDGEVAARFAYDPAEFLVETGERRGGRTDHHVLVDCGFAFPEPVDGRAVSMGAEYYRSLHLGPDGRAPCVMVVPILGGGYSVCRGIAARLTRAGVHAFIPLRDAAVMDPGRDAQSVEGVLVTSTVRLRRALDWLERRPEVDGARLGVVGVSLGGIRAVILSAVEPRLVACVFVMAGGDLGTVMAGSVEPEVVRYRQARMAAEGLDLEAFRSRFQERLRTDPLLLAPYVDARRVLQFVTTRDRTVPTSCQERLHRAMGAPEAWLVPTGHYSAALYVDPIEDEMTAFFLRRFGMGSAR